MHLFRASALHGFIEIAQQFQLDLQTLLDAAGLPPDALATENSDRYYSLSGFEKLHTSVESATGRCDLAALHGKNQEISALLGILGFYIQQGRTIREALHILQHYLAFQVQGVSVSVYEIDSLATLEFFVKDAHNLQSIRYSTEYALAAANSLLASLCGPGWKPQSIDFVHDEPKGSGRLQNHYSAPIFFSQEKNALSFKADDLEIPIATANPQLKKILQKTLAELEDKFDDNLALQVEHLIHGSLISGKCSAESIASFLGVHRRTMYRQLKEQGTSYTDILNRTRMDIAVNMLKQSSLSITKISLMLGYAELSAFSRAFKGWTGSSPIEYRDI